MCSEEVPCWQTQAQRSSRRALASSRLTEMVPSFPPQACRLSCHLCCSTSLTPPTIQPHKDVLLGAEQKGTWLDLYPWPPASGKPCSPYRSVTRNVNKQLPDQCGLPAPPLPSPTHARPRVGPVQLSQQQRWLSLIVSGRQMPQELGCLLHEAQHRTIYKKCNFTHRGKKDVFVIDDGEVKLLALVPSWAVWGDESTIRGTKGALVAN